MNTINPQTRSLPVVSVVTPTYNQASYLRDTIESVLSQDYPRIEYRVYDDGSTDSTREILAEYNGRVEWETHPNMGQTPTINKGWKLAVGDILTWLNSDDTFLPGAVSWAVAYLQKHPEVDIVYGDTLFTCSDGTPIEKNRVIKGFEKGFDYEKFVLQCENPIPQPSSFIRRRVIDRVGMLDPAYYYFMDWDFWLRAGLQHRIVYVPEVLSTYRLHSESKTVSQSLKAAPELERMYKLYFENRDLPKNILKIKSKAMANMYFATGGYLLKGDDRISALAASQKALLSDPWLLTTRQGLQKLAYCSLGHKSMYKWGRSTWYQIQEVVGLR